jgi:hypothetical protein
MEKKVFVSTWVIPKIKEKIVELAKSEPEARSVQSMVRILLHESLKWREIHARGEICKNQD